MRRNIFTILVAMVATLAMARGERYEDTAPTWDADTEGNGTYDPDSFDCNVGGNGTCDPGGIPVNGTAPGYHAGLPCYLDFADIADFTPGQYKSLRARWCQPAG